MKKILLSLAAVCWLLPAFADDHLISEDEFTKRFVEQLAAGSDNAIDIEVTESLSMTLSYPDGREFETNLHNAYELYTNDPDGLEDVLAQYVNFALESLEPRPEQLAVADIVPVVKDDAWVTEMIRYTKERGGDDIGEMYRQTLAPGLTILYAEDTPTSIRYIQEDVIAEAEVDLTTIRALAVENLLSKLPELEVAGGPGLYMLIADGNYEASLLLVDGIWNSENFDVAGDIVVSIPSRDVLLISGTDNLEKLEMLRNLRDQSFAESPYRITTTLYRRQDGAWVPWK